MNLWPPFIGAGIHVARISPDFREISVRLRMGLLNRNYVGTHFGGSLFAMTDPFYMLMMMRNLGPDYIVWDKHSRIDFRRPARGRVWAHFGLGEEQLSTARQQCEGGAKFEPTYTIDIVDASGEVVATVDKTLYIRRRPGPRSADAATRCDAATP
ncbi:MAG: DUF4442 domain-containing protein [Zoogloeaceae bacterium]|nr:DUF4442 domain-containing protein [Zoogloeaceae bacterium]